MISSSSNNPGLRTRAALLALDFQDMYLRWGANQPPRTGLHASSLLVSEQEWCTRRYVLSEMFPSEAVQTELKQWQWKQQAIFENGWDLHRRWQRLFLKFAKVVIGDVATGKPYERMRNFELDLTHYDPDRNVYLSPDAILDIAGEHMVVDIKGINHDQFTGHEELYKRTVLKDSAYTFGYEKAQEYRKGVKDCTLEEAMKLSETVAKAYFQCQLYMHLLELKHGIILVEDKNTQDFRLWIVEYDRRAASEVPMRRVYDVKGWIVLARANGTYPSRVCQSPDDVLARKCPMAKCCFSH